MSLKKKIEVKVPEEKLVEEKDKIMKRMRTKKIMKRSIDHREKILKVEKEESIKEKVIEIRIMNLKVMKRREKMIDLKKEDLKEVDSNLKVNKVWVLKIEEEKIIWKVKIEELVKVIKIINNRQINHPEVDPAPKSDNNLLIFKL